MVAWVSETCEITLSNSVFNRSLDNPNHPLIQSQNRVTNHNLFEGNQRPNFSHRIDLKWFKYAPAAVRMLRSHSHGTSTAK